MTLYRTIVADPPWRYTLNPPAKKYPGRGASAESYYPTMTMEEILEDLKSEKPTELTRRLARQALSVVARPLACNISGETIEGWLTARKASLKPLVAGPAEDAMLIQAILQQVQKQLVLRGDLATMLTLGLHRAQVCADCGKAVPVGQPHVCERRKS